jgi:hypothetical protein
MKIGTWIKILKDQADGAIVNIGDIGMIVDHPEHPYRNEYIGRGLLAVEFNTEKNIYGAYGPKIAVFTPSNIQPIWTDDDLFE